ncbi:ABC transporter permease [Salipaludibacillus sp. HK11]|uniref:ABC transporter permease n=1 Tax=Salipaludibacillus sp. HK11 TaxID=3394320 RepID=UPI0039FDBFCB
MKIFITIFNRWPACYTLFLVAIAWEGTSRFYPSVIIPSPLETISTLQQMIGTRSFWDSLWLTFLRLVGGFSIAFMSGALLGSLIGRYNKAYKITRPLVVIIQSIPPVSWILLAILWFGINGGAQMTVVALSLFPIFFFHTSQAIRQVPIELLELAQVYEVGFIKTMKAIYIPSIKPLWMSAMIITVGIGWKTIVMAEVISGQTGIGAVMNTSRIYLKTDEVIAWTLVVACLGISTEAVMRKLSGGGGLRNEI